MDWLTDHKLPLGKWIKGLVDWMLDSGAELFDVFSDSLSFVIEGLALGQMV